MTNGSSVARSVPDYLYLDQIRTVDKARLLKKLGRLNRQTQGAVLAVLAEMFAE